MSLYVDRTKKERKKQESGAWGPGGLVGAMGLVWLGLTDGQMNLCIELRYAQLIIKVSKLAMLYIIRPDIRVY